MSEILTGWLFYFSKTREVQRFLYNLSPRRTADKGKEDRIMALTRKLLKGMGLTDEQVDTIIEAHTDTVDGLKADITRFKADAEKLPGIQKELDDLKAAGDDGYKERYEKEHSAFEAYKTDITAKESKAAKEKAVRAYFESKNITGTNLDLAMRGCGEEMAALELDGDKIKDTKSLDTLVEGTYKGLVSTTQTQGANPANPPANTPAKSYTTAEIKNMTAAEINANWDSIKASLNQKGE